MDFQHFLNATLKRKMTRKDFLKFGLSLAALLPLLGRSAASLAAEKKGFNGRPKRKIPADYDLVSVRGEDAYAATVKAIASLGGMEKFVAKNSVVVIKPNIGWDRTPEQAANTHPDVVGALIDLSFKAGAKRVNIFDVPCNDARRCYDSSGIAKVAEAKGANIYIPDDWDVIKAQFDYDSPMQGWPILRDAVACDTFINVPVLKHHRLTGLTLSMKNLMGVCTGTRGVIHQGIGRKLVDLTDFIQPELTVIDAMRVLIRNGPTGGNLEDVVTKNTVIASLDPTLADIFASKLVDVDPRSVPNIDLAFDRGFGITDLAQARILTIPS